MTHAEPMPHTVSPWRGRAAAHAFSLIEVLLAIFILGIGVIAVAALFPAGIAQQRQSVDDIIGAVVANNALSTLRLKLRPEDFGTFEEFSPTGAILRAPLSTIEGDWTWLRPGVALGVGATPDIDERGWLDIFSAQWPGSPSLATEFSTSGSGYVDPSGTPSSPPLYGIPYAAGSPPLITISQGDRYYPNAHADAFVNQDLRKPKPQYVWDCMFRRYQGRILVAIFVYRVAVVGGGSVTYTVPPNYSEPDVPPLPVHVDLTLSGSHSWNGNPWDAVGDDVADPSDDAIIKGTDPMSDADYDPASDLAEFADAGQSWQAPSQWLLDQNNNIHRVLVGRRRAADGPVELARPVSPVPLLGPPSNPYLMTRYILAPTNAGFAGLENVVTNIWYIPAEIQLDVTGNLEPNLPATLTPVYVTVREL